MIRIATIALAVSPWFLLSGCGGASTATPTSSARAPSAAPDPAFVLSEEPASPKNVAEVRKHGKDGEEVVVAGWIGGSETPIVQGRAAFTMVDLSMPPLECTEKPYSFCCLSKDALLPNLIMVKFVDDNGKTIPKDARELLGIKEGCVVVVRGRLECSEDGAVNAIAASGLYNRGYTENPTKLAVFNTGFRTSK